MQLCARGYAAQAVRLRAVKKNVCLVMKPFLGKGDSLVPSNLN